MKTRGASICGVLLLVAGLTTDRAVQAQCANNSAGPFQTCFGTNSLMTDTSDDDVAFGYNALRWNTTGERNSAAGINALTSNTTGSFNTAFGYFAMGDNTTGTENTAVGHGALAGVNGSSNTAVGSLAMSGNPGGASNDTAVGQAALERTGTGSNDTAVGQGALQNNTTGANDTAVGQAALQSVTGAGSDGNTAVGASALQRLTFGLGNLALGVNAGANYTRGESGNIMLANPGAPGESFVTRIGTGLQTKVFVFGIYGVTSSAGTLVLVNAAGQLGTTTSSLRFKEDVADLGASSGDLMKLRPVTFHYKPQYDDGQRVLQYGLIAEEVAQVNPGLVQFGEDGKPLAVRYHFLNAMLLDEVQKQHATISSQAAEIASQRAMIEDLALRLARLEGEKASRP